MGKRDMDRIYSPMPMPHGGQAVEKLRDRTPQEVIADGYMGVVQVAAINTVTQLGMASVQQCEIKRLQIMAEFPNLESILTGLLYNHARLIADVQQGVITSTKRVV